MLTQDEVKRLLHYDPETGIFRWRFSVAPKVKPWDVAGTIENRRGYSRICVNGKLYWAHRLAWFYMYGTWPAGDIDHINGNKGDNRLANIRDVNRSVNMQNLCKPSKNNASEYLGVSWSIPSKKWRARIRVNGKERHLGVFDTAEQAHDAYKKAKRVFHPGGML